MDLEHITDTVRRALEEDIGPGDLTASLIPKQSRAKAEVISREHALLCGAAWFESVFHQLDPNVDVSWLHSEGEWMEAGQIICELNGPARPMLTGERTALNFLQTLSATATCARRYVEAVAGTGVKILDTRKTLPGLRYAQKFAAKCGGCHNHRMGLYDGILIKENHIAAAGSIAAAVRQAKISNKTDILIEVEAENLEQVKDALQAGAGRILLDNFNLEDLAAATKIVGKQIPLEASGGVTLDNVRLIAETGIDYISVGEITKHIHAVDLSMRFTEV